MNDVDSEDEEEIVRYICYDCGEKFAPDPEVRGISCPKCKGKVVYKIRPKVGKSLKAE